MGLGPALEDMMRMSGTLDLQIGVGEVTWLALDVERRNGLMDCTDL